MRDIDYLLLEDCSLQIAKLNRTECCIGVKDELYAGYITSPKTDKIFHFNIQKIKDKDLFHSLTLRYGTLDDTLELVFKDEFFAYRYFDLIDACEAIFSKKGIEFLNKAETLYDPDTPFDKKSDAAAYISAWLHHRLSSDYTPEERERLHEKMFELG